MAYYKKAVKCIIYYTKTSDVFNLEDDLYILSRRILFDIDKNDVIAEFEEDTLFDILEKIYNEVYINELYEYIPYLKINLLIDDFPNKTFKFNIKDDIIRFKQKYDKSSFENYDHDSLYYILQSLNKLYIDQHRPILNLDDLDFILNKDCKVKFLNLHNYKNINILQQFLINNKDLDYLHICLHNSYDIKHLCDGLTKNEHLTSLDLRYSNDLTYNDFIQIINSSNTITNYNFSNILLRNILNLDLLLNALMVNTKINSFSMIGTRNRLDNKLYTYYELYYPLDNIIINLIRNNSTLTLLDIFDDRILSCFKSFDKSILEGLENNINLINLGEYDHYMSILKYYVNHNKNNK